MVFKKLFGDAKTRYNERQKRKRQEQIANESYNAAVNKLLNEFTIPQLDKFFKNYLGKMPEMQYHKDNKTDKEIAQMPSRKNYMEFVWAHLDDVEITYGQLKNHSIKERIVPLSFFADEDDAEYEKDVFGTIIKSIRDGFIPQKIKNEEHLEAQLMVYLQAKFPSQKIMRQVTIHGNDKIDILIDDKYAVELKVPSARIHLRNLGAQLEEYQEKYPDICAVIFDAGENDLTQDIAYYSDKFKRNYNIPSIIIEGEKRG